MARVYIKPPNQKRDLSLNFSHTNKTQTRMTITVQKKNCHSSYLLSNKVGFIKLKKIMISWSKHKYSVIINKIKLPIYQMKYKKENSQWLFTNSNVNVLIEWLNRWNMSINQVSLHQFNFLNFILLQFNSVLNELYTDGIWDFFRQQVFIFSFKLLVSLMNFWTDISQFLPESKNKKKTS